MQPSTTLFEPGPRDGPEYMALTGNNYEFYRSCPRPDVIEMCDELERWFVPFPGKTDRFLGRFRGGNIEHDAAFFELYCHELLHRLGFGVEHEPAMPNGARTTPEYRLLLAEVPVFYFEATLAAPGEKEQGADTRKARFLEALDGCRFEKFRLTLSMEDVGPGDLGAKQVAYEIRKWLAGLDPDDLLRRAEDLSFVPPELEWDKEGWNFSISPVALPSERRGVPYEHALVCWSDGIHCVRTDKSIGAAVSTKASKYGDPDLPYIIAVNTVDEHPDDFAFMNALFGSDATQYEATECGTILSQRQIRNPDGSLVGPGGWKNTRVSAVLLAPGIGPWTAAMKTPILYHNPEAKRPLLPQLWPLAQRVPDLLTNTMKLREGKAAQDFFRFIPTANRSKV